MKSYDIPPPKNNPNRHVWLFDLVTFLPCFFDCFWRCVCLIVNILSWSTYHFGTSEVLQASSWPKPRGFNRKTQRPQEGYYFINETYEGSLMNWKLCFVCKKICMYIVLCVNLGPNSPWKEHLNRSYRDSVDGLEKIGKYTPNGDYL